MAANARHDLANIVGAAGYERWLLAVALTLMLVACDGAEDAPPPAHAARFGLNDVSILLPMPSTAADGNLLRFGDLGVGGPLLPQAWFDDIAVFATEPHVAPPYASWAIVGIRLDPCFPTLALLASDPSQCRRQVRLIAQPIVEEFGAAGTIDPAVAIDSAVHLLFDLGASEFEQFLTAWMAQVAAAPSDVAAPLQVHPVIASEGLGGPFAVDLRRLILATVGEARLSQVTFMEGRTFDWEFGGLRIIDGVRRSGRRAVFSRGEALQLLPLVPIEP